MPSLAAHTLEAMITGASIGLAAGVSPGPLLTLVVTASLERGFGAGARVAMGPLIADFPIILVALVFTANLPPVGLQVLTLVGGLFVVYLGVGTIRRAGETVEARPGAAPKDLLNGALVNLMSPSPWLFWLGIGAPQIVGLWRKGGGGAAAFLGFFYAGLIGSKLVISALVARGRSSLGGSGYRRVVIFCGLLLVGLGGWLIVQGLLGLGVST